jgi:predicted dehydrogenase
MSKQGLLVGCGYFAGIHLDAWKRLMDRAQIVAVCDIDREKAEQRALAFGIPHVYTDVSEAMRRTRPHFVDIVTRPDTHAEICRAAIGHGSAVLCQKPLAPTLEEAEQMVAACAEQNVPLMVNENWRWQPWYRELKRLLDAGTIGRPHYLALRHRMSDGVGEQPYPRQPYFSQMPRLLLIETMIHFLDTARFLVGELSVRHAVLRRLNPHVVGEDLLVLVLEGGEQLTAVIDGNRLSEPEQDGTVMGDARIEGSLGTLSLLGDGRIFVRPIGGSPVEHRYRIPTHGYRGDSAYATLSHFIDCLESGAPFETSGPDYLQTSRLVFDAYRMAGW